jgi:hypothetical protein
VKEASTEKHVNGSCSSVAVQALRILGGRALVLVLGAVVATASSGCASKRTGPLDQHVLPQSFVDVSVVNFDRVASVDVDLHTAVQSREAVESEFKRAYGRTGHPRWFFHAFDVTSLDFVVARYEPTAGANGRYVAERRLRVKRSREAERALGVMDVVLEYGTGTRGVKPGMARQDVVKIAGKPELERQLGRPGAFDLRYPAFCVRFVDAKVAHVWRREKCTE